MTDHSIYYKEFETNIKLMHISIIYMSPMKKAIFYINIVFIKCEFPS